VLTKPSQMSARERLKAKLDAINKKSAAEALQMDSDASDIEEAAPAVAVAPKRGRKQRSEAQWLRSQPRLRN